MGLAHSPRIVTNGLVLCLDAGNTQSYPGSGTTWTDISRRGNNGTLTNGPTFSSTNKGAIVFDGANDIVDIPSIGLTGPFAFFGFVYRQSISGAQVFFGEDSGSAAGGPKIGLSNNLNEMFIRIISTQVSITIPGIQTWICVAITRDSSNKVDVYVNAGEPTRLYTDVAQNGTFTFNRLGANGSDASQLFNGRIAQVSVYNRALSASEVAQNFNALRGRFGI